MRTVVIRQDSSVKAVTDYLNQLPKDGSIVVEIKKAKKGRTLAQNALLWKWETEMGNELGYTKEEMHEVLAEKFLPWKDVIDLDGMPVKVRTSTSKLGVGAFAEYLQHIERLAAQLGIILPRPEDVYYEALGYVQDQSSTA